VGSGVRYTPLGTQQLGSGTAVRRVSVERVAIMRFSMPPPSVSVSPYRADAHPRSFSVNAFGRKHRIEPNRVR